MHPKANEYLQRLEKAQTLEERRSIATEFHAFVAALSEPEKAEVKAHFKPLIEEERRRRDELEIMVGELRRRYASVQQPHA